MDAASFEPNRCLLLAFGAGVVAVWTSSDPPKIQRKNPMQRIAARKIVMGFVFFNCRGGGIVMVKVGVRHYSEDYSTETKENERTIVRLCCKHIQWTECVLKRCLSARD